MHKIGKQKNSDALTYSNANDNSITANHILFDNIADIIHSNATLHTSGNTKE